MTEPWLHLTLVLLDNTFNTHVKLEFKEENSLILIRSSVVVIPHLLFACVNLFLRCSMFELLGNI